MRYGRRIWWVISIDKDNPVWSLHLCLSQGPDKWNPRVSIELDTQMAESAIYQDDRRFSSLELEWYWDNRKAAMPPRLKLMSS